LDTLYQKGETIDNLTVAQVKSSEVVDKLDTVVYFDMASTVLKPEMKKILDAFAGKSYNVINIDGFVQDTNTPDSNQPLSVG
jgi:outer membrane protein OmpA-like peptidoglycan-associated protein